MRKHKLFNRLLIPTLIVLLLLPPLSCLIFYQSARQYAYNEASRDLEALHQKILPLMNSSFAVSDSTPSGQVKDFLSQVGPLMSRTSGDARLMILEARMHLIYPRNDQDRAAITPLAEEFTRHIQSTDMEVENGTKNFQASDGKTYLVNIYKVPTESVQIRYLIAYCPTSQIGGWVGKASILVLAISSLFGLLTFAVLWMTTRSIAQPLHRLCREVERIGSGSFAEIEPEFSLKELEELRLAMNRMSVQLMRSDDIQKNFFQNVSHELRSPLMSISGYAQGIEQGIFQSSKEAAHTILAESVRLTELVNSLLVLSRMESGQYPPILGPLAIADSIVDCLDRVHGLALQKGISVSLSPYDPKLMVYGEEELLGQVLDNLLTNAIRYAKTSVIVSVLAEDSQVSISVSDDGEGIAKKDMPHLFKRCYKGKGGNFGIGLAIAHTAAQGMNGELSADNRLAGGAVFTLSLRKIPASDIPCNG